MDQKQLQIRSILHKLAGVQQKRKREDPNNPLVAYCNALIIPHIQAGTTPDIPFDIPELLQKLHEDNNAVHAFPIHEYWMDIGHLE